MTLTLTTHILDVDWTLVKELTGVLAGSRSYAVGIDGRGAGSLAIPNDHADWAQLYGGRLIRLTLDDGTTSTAIGAWMIDPNYQAPRLVAGGDGDLVTLWSGEDGFVKLGTDRRPRTVIVDPTGSGVLRLGWMVESFDDGSWTEPTDRGYVVDSLPDGQDMPDSQAQWIGATFASGNPTYARRFLDTSARPVKQGANARAYFTGQGTWRAYWDGELAASGNAYEVSRVNVGTLNSTGHQVAIYSDAGPVGFTLVRVAADGTEDGVLYRSFTTGVRSGDPDSWVGLEDGSTPTGITAGFAAAYIIDAAQARSALSGITYTFTATVDSDAVAWTTELEQVSWRDPSQVGDVIDQIRDQFGVDAAMAPDGELQLWDSRGSDLSATIELTNGTLAAKTARQTGGGERANVARIATGEAFGWSDGGSGVPAGANERIEVGLTFGTAETTAEVGTAVTETLATMGDARRQVIRVGEVAGKIPFVDFNVGDTISAAELDGSYYDVRVVGITLLDLPGDQPEFDVEVERRL